MLFIFSLCFMGNTVFSMAEEVQEDKREQKEDELVTLTTSLQEASLQETRGKEWDWFITYANLSPRARGVSCIRTPFDPAVRFYDEKDKMILLVQRITLDGKNTDFPTQEVSIGMGERKGGGSVMLLQDKGEKILALAIGGKYPNVIESYDSKGERDLVIKGGGAFMEGVIRLSPSYIVKGTDYEEIFKKLREIRDQKNSDASLIVLAK